MNRKLLLFYKFAIFLSEDEKSLRENSTIVT